MKRKLWINAVLALGLALTLAACRNDSVEPVETADGQMLTFLPSVKGMNEEPVSLRSGNMFFEEGDTITVTITTSREGASAKEYPYTYKGGTFTGGFLFTPDNTSIANLEAYWPEKNSPARKAIITDQRKREDYRLANRMTAKVSSANILPTSEPVPLIFEREQSRLTFRLAGQNANGLIIKKILLEINADLDDGEGVKGVCFWAYCEEDGTLNATMILPAGVQLGPNSASDGREKIGLVTVGTKGDTDPSNDYRGIIYIPNSTHITMQPNYEYLVTLTPEGYDLNATIEISGFTPSEGRVAIPFQLPVDSDNNEVYEIDTVAQLVTISWLLEGDLNGELQSVWSSRTFDITAPITVSDKIRAEGNRFLKTGTLTSNKERFENSDKVTYSDGSSVFGSVL